MKKLIKHHDELGKVMTEMSEASLMKKAALAGKITQASIALTQATIETLVEMDARITALEKQHESRAKKNK